MLLGQQMATAPLAPHAPPPADILTGGPAAAAQRRRGPYTNTAELLQPATAAQTGAAVGLEATPVAGMTQGQLTPPDANTGGTGGRNALDGLLESQPTGLRRPQRRPLTAGPLPPLHSLPPPPAEVDSYRMRMPPTHIRRLVSVGDVVLLSLDAPQALLLPLRLDACLAHDAHSVMYRVTATQGALPATATPMLTPPQQIHDDIIWNSVDGAGTAQTQTQQLPQRYVLRILFSSDDLGLQGVHRTSHDFQLAGRAAEEAKALSSVYDGDLLLPWHWTYPLPQPAEPPNPVLHMKGTVRGRHALLLADAEASLAQVLAGGRQLREADVQDLTRQMVANLARAASRGVLHGNFSAHSVLLRARPATGNPAVATDSPTTTKTPATATAPVTGTSSAAAAAAAAAVPTGGILAVVLEHASTPAAATGPSAADGGGSTGGGIGSDGGGSEAAAWVAGYDVFIVGFCSPTSSSWQVYAPRHVPYPRCAPELLSGNAYTTQADVFQLGVLVLHMMSGVDAYAYVAAHFPFWALSASQDDVSAYITPQRVAAWLPNAPTAPPSNSEFWEFMLTDGYLADLFARSRYGVEVGRAGSAGIGDGDAEAIVGLRVGGMQQSVLAAELGGVSEEMYAAGDWDGMETWAVVAEEAAVAAEEEPWWMPFKFTDYPKPKNVADMTSIVVCNDLLSLSAPDYVVASIAEHGPFNRLPTRYKNFLSGMLARRSRDRPDYDKLQHTELLDPGYVPPAPPKRSARSSGGGGGGPPRKRSARLAARAASKGAGGGGKRA